MSETKPKKHIELLVTLDPGVSCVVGAPGSGKTTQLLLAVSALEKKHTPEKILVLTPGRAAATALRDQIALGSDLASSVPRARSLSSFAFELLREANPKLALLSGPNQQQLLTELIKQTKDISGWGLNPKALGLQAFSQELRDLIQVVMEFGLTAQDLEGLAQSHPKLKLGPAIDLLPQYLERLSEGGVLDPASLLTQAATRLGPGYDWVLVDDAQDLSTAGLQLIKQLAKHSNVIMFGDPDSSVQGFRAAEPGEFLALGKQQILSEAMPQPPKVQQIMAKLVSRIGPAGAGRQRAAIKSGAEDLSALIFSSTSAEADYLAARLRRLRLEKKVPFSQMVVVVRTRTQLDQLSRELAARNVPVVSGAQSEPLNQNPLTRAMLEVCQLALAGKNQELISGILLSSFIGLNSIELRRLERQLSHHFGLPIAQAWEQVLEVGFEFDSREARQLNRLLDLIAKVRDVEINSAHELVSLVWEFAPSNLARLALGGSTVALAANRDLDAVLRLFAAAQRFDQRSELKPAEFVSQQLGLQIAEDSLARTGRSDSVLVTTSSSLAGQHFSVVAIPRLQDGIWPNLRPRNSLLGASSLRSFLSGRSADPVAPLKNELSDELRLFYKAIGACRGELILSAMRSADEQPSQIFALAGIGLVESDSAIDFDLRRLTGRLRRRLAEGDQSVAGLLAGFALAGIAGADPSNWQGLLAKSSNDPIFDASEPITLTASSLEAFEQCPLHWFVKTFAVGQSNFQASLGTLLHSAFELAKEPGDISKFVESNWHTLEFENGWQSDAQKRRALQMAMLAGNYLAENPNPLAIEQGFELEFGRLRIRGKIDRIERTAGGLVVADLKTGKSNLDATKNLQLAIYQLAVAQMHPEEKILGARLVSIGTGKLKESDQLALDAEFTAELHSSFQNFEQQGSQGFVTANLSEHCQMDGSCRLLLARQVCDA